MLAIGHVINDRYRIEALLGLGGMGAVYRAHDGQADMQVAVKVLTLPPGNSQLRFRREFRVMSRLEHPHVVRVFDTGMHGDVAYLVMAYLAGGSLADAFGQAVTDEHDLAERMRLMVVVAEALAYVHAQGIVHRDLKPENVLLHDGEPYLMDFGLSRADQHATVALTQVGEVMGTAAYMSPEQARGHTVDARSDLYAFGCMLYWALVGEPPFSGESFVDIILKQIRNPAAPPSHEVAWVPPRLDALVLALLEKAPEDRISSAAEVAAEMRSIVASLGRAEGVGASSQPAPVMGEPAANATPGQLLRAPLIGRDEAWQALVGALATTDRGRTVVVEGDTGLGSSRLLDEFAREARSRQLTVVRVVNPRGARNVPYDGWKRALTGLRSAEPAAFASAAAGLEAPLSWLLPSAFPDVSPPNLPDDVAQLRLFDSVDQLLGRLAERRSLSLLVDDLHEADEGTVSLVSYLARGVASERVPMVVTVHPLRASPSASGVVRHLEARRVKLTPLADDDARALVRELLGGHVDEGLQRHVAERSGGNPFFVQELLGALLRAGEIKRQAGAWTWNRSTFTLPPSINEVFVQRIEGLATRARGSAAAASAIGQVFGFELLQTLLGAGEDDLLDDLDELMRANLIEEGSHDHYRFTHPLLWETLHQTMPARRRRRYHQTLAEVLSASATTPPEVLAEHYVETDHPEAAAPHAIEAARRAEQVFANDVAERYYRLALELLPGDAGERAEATLALARVYDRVGRWDEAERLFMEARDDPSTRLRALKSLGTHWQVRGDLTASERFLREALTDAPDDPETYRLLGSTLNLREAFDEARTMLQAALALATSASDVDPLGPAVTQIELGYLEFTLGRIEGALTWYHSAQASLSSAQEPLLQARLDKLIGLVHYAKGDLSNAQRSFEEAHRVFEDAGDVARALGTLYNLGMVFEETGANTRAASVFEEIRDRAHRYGDAQNAAKAAATWGWLLQRVGRYDEALEQLRHASEYLAGQGYHSYAQQTRLNTAVVLARKGEIEAARQELDLASQAIDDEPLAYQSALQILTLGEIELRAGAVGPALAHFAAAIEAFEAIESQHELMEASLLYAEALLALGSGEALDVALSRASTIAQTLADSCWRTQVEYLRALGHADAPAIAEIEEATLDEENLLPFVRLVQRTLAMRDVGTEPSGRAR